MDPLILGEVELIDRHADLVIILPSRHDALALDLSYLYIEVDEMIENRFIIRAAYGNDNLIPESSQANSSTVLSQRMIPVRPPRERPYPSYPI